MMQALSKRYGTSFTVRLPFFGPTVIISDPALVKQFFQTRTDVVCNVEPNLDLVLGPGSTFGLQDEQHRRRRKLLVPRFTGSGCGPTRTSSRRKRSRRSPAGPRVGSSRCWHRRTGSP